MTPTKQSPETRARELADFHAAAILSANTDSRKLIKVLDNLQEELTTLITKADALDSLLTILRNSNARHLTPESDDCKWLMELPMFDSEYKAITEAMKGRK